MSQEMIEVVHRAGFWEARRRGTSGKVFGRTREQAVERAAKWRSRHQQPKPEVVCLGFGRLGRARAEAEEARYDLA